MHRPLVLIMLAYTAGILGGRGFLFFPLLTLVGLGLALGSAALAVWFDRLTLRRFALVAVAFLAAMAAYMYSAAWFPRDDVSRIIPPSDKSPHEFTGRISSPLDRDQDRTSALLALVSIDGRPASGKARITLRDGRTSVGYGDVISVRGRVFEPRGYANPGGFDYRAFLARSGVFRTIAVRGDHEPTVLERGTGAFRFIQDLRERMRRAFLAALHGPGSAILQAMVLGEEGGLTEDLRDRFMAAGVTHIISISGSHLGMVALLCFALIRGFALMLPEAWYHRLTLSMDPRKLAAGITVPLIVFYSLLAGGQLATIRALIMISAGLFALLLDRDHALLHALALAALFILLGDPQALFDLSFQLSFLSVLAIAALIGLRRELGLPPKTGFRKIRNNLVLLIVISLAASLATGPLVARSFHQVSLAGVFANLFVVPFAGMVVVPLGLFSAILSLFRETLPLAGVNQFAADAFLGLVNFFSRLPYAEIHTRAPGIPWLLIYLLMLTNGFLWLRAHLLARLHPLEQSRRPPRLPRLLCIGSAAVLLLLSLPFVHRAGASRITFLDVGQGDCTVIELASGRTILIDGGGVRDNRFDIGRRIVAPFLWSRGIERLDIVMLSHPHPDHMNGLLYVLRKFSAGELWTHGYDGELPGYDALKQVAAERRIPQRIASAESPEAGGEDAAIRVLHPAEGFASNERKAYAAENDRSLVVRIALASGVFLFPGDIGSRAEAHLAGASADPGCTVLKVPHHGSRSSSSAAFVSRTRPKVAVISVGGNNPYGHPADEVLERYERVGARIYRTDRDGAVMVTGRDGEMSVACSRELALRTIDLRAPAAWPAQERENLRRLRLNSWGT